MREQFERSDVIALSPPPVRGEVFTKLMKIPGVQMIYVAALACTRHRNIDFIEMQRRGRLAYLMFTEVDMITGDYIEKTKQAAAEIAAERSATGIILLTGCQSALLSTDYKLLTEEMEQEIGFPVRVHDGCRLCGFDEDNANNMDQLLYSFLRPAEKSSEISVNILGSVEFDRSSELFALLERAGVKKINTLSACRDFSEYQQMSAAHVNILTNAQDVEIGRSLQESLGIPYICLGGMYDCAVLEEEYRKLGEILGVTVDIAPLAEHAKGKLQALKQAVGSRPIAVTGDAELAKFLLIEGFSVQSLTMNHHMTLTPDQKIWFKENAPHVKTEHGGKGGPGGPGGGRGMGGPGGRGPGGPGGGRGMGGPGGRGPGGPGFGRGGRGGPGQGGALKLGFAGTMAVLAALEEAMGGAAR